MPFDTAPSTSCFDDAKLLLFCETAVTLFAGKVALSGEKHFSVALPSFITPSLDRAMTERRARDDRETKKVQNRLLSCICQKKAVTLQLKVAKTMEIQHLHSIQDISKQYMTGDLPVLVLCSDTQQYICKYMRPNNSNYGKLTLKASNSMQLKMTQGLAVLS